VFFFFRNLPESANTVQTLFCIIAKFKALDPHSLSLIMLALAPSLYHMFSPPFFEIFLCQKTKDCQYPSSLFVKKSIFSL